MFACAVPSGLASKTSLWAAGWMDPRGKRLGVVHSDEHGYSSSALTRAELNLKFPKEFGCNLIWAKNLSGILIGINFKEEFEQV